MFVHRAIQIQTVEQGGLRTFFFRKDPLDFLDYSLNPRKFQRQFHFWKFHKIALHPLAFTLEFHQWFHQTPMTKTPWKFHDLFLSPLEIPHFFLLNPGISIFFYFFNFFKFHVLISLPFLDFFWNSPFFQSQYS